MRIWKFPINMHRSTTTHEIPEGGKFLHVEQVLATGEVAMWFLVDAAAKKQTKKTFKFFGTGAEVPEDGYLGTFVLDIFVWHLYEI